MSLPTHSTVFFHDSVSCLNKSFYQAKKVNGWVYCIPLHELIFLAACTPYCTFFHERDDRKLMEQVFCCNCLAYGICGRLQIMESSSDPVNGIKIHNFYYSGKIEAVLEINRNNYRLCDDCQQCFILYGTRGKESYLKLTTLEKRNKKLYLFNIVWVMNHSPLWKRLPKEIKQLIFEFGKGLNFRLLCGRTFEQWMG